MADEVGVLAKALDVPECLVRRDGMSVAELADAAASPGRPRTES